MDLISIIIPVYKVPEKLLRRCIESAIGQNYPNVEIILVDDGSPDNCGNICDEYAEKNKCVKVVHQANKGLSGARNSGVKASTGKWFMFIDGDDWIEKSMCSELIKSITEDIDIVCSGYMRDFNNKKIEVCDYSKYFENDKIYMTEKELNYMKLMTLNFSAYMSSSCGKLIKKELVELNEIYFDEKLKQGAEGIEYCYRLFDKAKKIKVKNSYYYHYIYNSNSISKVSTEENNYMILQCFEKIYDYIKNDKEFLNKFYERIVYVIVTTILRGYFSPKNKIKYSKRIEGLNKYLDNAIVKETLKKYEESKIDRLRNYIIILAKSRKYFILYIISYVKYFTDNFKS